jgi:hypothetical protein
MGWDRGNTIVYDQCTGHIKKFLLADIVGASTPRMIVT